MAVGICCCCRSLVFFFVACGELLGLSLTIFVACGELMVCLCALAKFSSPAAS